MVLGRRRFTWRSDVRGVVTVMVLGLTTMLVAAVLMALVLLLGGRG